jgi:hypothetical protein
MKERRSQRVLCVAGPFHHIRIRFLLTYVSRGCVSCSDSAATENDTRSPELTKQLNGDVGYLAMPRGAALLDLHARSSLKQPHLRCEICTSGPAITQAFTGMAFEMFRAAWMSSARGCAIRSGGPAVVKRSQCEASRPRFNLTITARRQTNLTPFIPAKGCQHGLEIMSRQPMPVE